MNIPKEWSKIKFIEISDFKNGINYNSSDSGFRVRLLGVGDFLDKTILTDISNLNYIKTEKKLSIDYYLKKGDLVFVRSNGSKNLVGRCILINTESSDLTYSGFCIRARLNSQIKSTPDYISLLMQNGILKKQLIRDGRGTNISNLNQEILNNLELILPPLPEQKAISSLLSAWDEAIEKTELLIQKKETYYRKLRNELIYLPAKNKKWQEIKCGKLFTERRENRREDLTLLSITNKEGVIPRDETDRKDTSNEDKSKYLRICPGDIGYNTMRMWQGVSALSSLEGIISPAYTICIPGEKLYPQFVAFLFKTPFIIHRFYRYSQGLTSDTWNLKYNNFSEVKMPLPSLEEQKKIAETLSIVQQEIDLLKKLLEKYKTQKKGLMQKLLTGQWRIKPKIIDIYKEI